MKRFALVLALVQACDREERRFQDIAPSSDEPIDRALGEDESPSVSSRYAESAWMVSEGKSLYNAFNCSGCHGQGGGGMGPPLMDARWIYGSSPTSVFATIVEGRPEGMPSFRGKIVETDIWKLVAYVRSMSGNVRVDSRPARDDHMHAVPPPSTQPREIPVADSEGE
jgi:cytochrome c oxidase cbb3-type subunit III